MNFNSNLKTVLISFLVLLLFTFVSVIIISQLNLTSPTLIVTKGLFMKAEKAESDFSFSFREMKRNLKRSVTVEDVSISYKGEKIASIDTLEVEMGLRDLISYLVTGKEKARLTLGNVSFSVPPSLLEKGGVEKDGEKGSPTLPPFLSGRTLLFDIGTMDVDVPGILHVEGIHMEGRWGGSLDDAYLSVTLPSFVSVLPSVPLSASALSLRVWLGGSVKAEADIRSLSYGNDEFSATASAVRAEARLESLSLFSPENIDASLTVATLDAVSSSLRAKALGFSASYSDGTASAGASIVTAEGMGGRAEVVSLSALTSDFSTLDLSFLSASLEKDGLAFLASLGSARVETGEAEASLSISSLSAEGLSSLTGSIIENARAEKLAARVCYGGPVSLSVSALSFIGTSNPLLEEIEAEIDASLSLSDGALGSYTLSIPSIYLGWGERREGNVHVEGNADKCLISFTYGSAMADLALSPDSKAAEGTVEIRDYDALSVLPLLPPSFSSVTSYFPHSSLFSLCSSFSLMADGDAPLGVSGSGDISLDITEVSLSSFTSPVSASLSFEIGKDGIRLPRLEGLTSYFAFSSEVSFDSDFLPSFTLGITSPEGREYASVKAERTEGKEYGANISVPLLSTTLSSTFDFSTPVFHGEGSMDAGGSVRPFSYSYSTSERDFRLESESISLSLSLAGGVNASVSFTGLETVRDSFSLPVTVDGSLSLTVTEEGFSFLSDGIKLGHLWVIPSSPDIFFTLEGNNEDIRIDDISIAVDGRETLRGKAYSVLSPFSAVLSLDETAGDGDVVFSLFNDGSFSGVFRARSLDFSFLGLSDMKCDMALSGRASRLEDLALEGKLKVSPVDTINDSRRITADIAVDSTTLKLEDLVYSAEKISLSVPYIHFDSLTGRLDMETAELDALGNRVDRQFPLSLTLSMEASAAPSDSLYSSFYNAIQKRGEGTSFLISLDSYDIDNGKIRGGGMESAAIFEKGGLTFSGTLLEGFVDLGAKKFSIASSVDGLVSMKASGDYGSGLSLNAIVGYFDIYAVSAILPSPLFLFESGIARGEVGLLSNGDGTFELTGYITADELSCSTFWAPDQIITLHNPRFDIWDGEIMSSVTRTTVTDKTDNSRRTIDMRAGAKLQPSLALEGYIVEMWMDEDNSVRIRLPLPELNIDILSSLYGHYYCDITPGEPMVNSGHVYLNDTVLSIGMNPYPEWYILKGSFTMDMAFSFVKNNRIIYPAGTNPIISIDIADNSTIGTLFNSSGFKVSGDLSIRGGEVFYFQKYFYIREGKVSFNNPDRFDPLVNLRATLRDYDSEGNRVEIHLVMKDNTFSNISPTLESSPAKDLNEIMGILGQSIIPSDTFGTVNVGSVASLVTEGLDILGKLGVVTTGSGISNLSYSLKQVFGVDSFSIHSNIVNNIISDTLRTSFSSEAAPLSPMARYLGGTTMNVGKYLSPDLYLQAMLHLEANSTAKDKYTLIADDLVLDTEISLEWVNPAFNVTFMTSPGYPSLYSVMDTFRFSISKTISL